MTLLRTACAPTLDEVVALVSAMRLDLGVEHRAQADLMTALVSTWGPAQVVREYVLGPGERPDFMLSGGIVIEMKGPRHMQGPVLRQLGRYAAHDEVTALVLATARAMTMPRQIDGKPLRTINLGAAWL